MVATTTPVRESPALPADENAPLLRHAPPAACPNRRYGGDGSEQQFAFFLYVLLSTTFRSFEAGVISSTMPSIRSTLNLSYTTEGTIAASPDYGIAPGSLLAIFVFRRWDAYPVMVSVTMGTGVAALLCALYPSRDSLVAARAVGGLLWSHAATHYPVWINLRGPPSSRRKSMWMASYQLSLLVGILLGYVVGGFTRTVVASSVTWVHLYAVEGLLMIGCAISLALGFEPDLIDIRVEGGLGGGRRRKKQKKQSEGVVTKFTNRWLTAQSADDSVSVDEKEDEDDDDDYVAAPQPSLCYLFSTLLRSPPFIFSVLLCSLVSGTVVFALYFITQVCYARSFTDSETVLMVSAVFVSSPGPGTLFGSWIVSLLGGYEDHQVTFGLALCSSVATLLSALLFPISRILWPGSTEAKEAPFIIACWLFFFTGGMSTPTLNGVAVSAVPLASHVASGLQFALANTGKIVIPQIGGAVIDAVGLNVGFEGTVLVCCILFFALAAVGFCYARNCSTARMGLLPNGVARDPD